MVCVLQSKLPRSRAVFQLYCAPFFFSPKLSTFYTFYWLRGTFFSLFTSTFAAQIHSKDFFCFMPTFRKMSFCVFTSRL